MNNWSSILEEILYLKNDISILSPEALDCLYGSMWGLNYRYTPLQECISKEKNKIRILVYTIKRLKQIVRHTDITFIKREVPRCGIGFGTYGWKYDHKLIWKAIKLKASLIDTAEGYGYGVVEIELGKALKKASGSIEVTTKVRRDHMSEKALINAATRSNEKLGVIPHYQLHFPHNEYTDEQLGSILAHLRIDKKIKSIGLSNCSVDMIESMQRFLSNYSGDTIRSVQMSYSLADRRIESVLLPYCQERGIVVLAYSPLGQSFKKMYKPVLDDVGKRYNATASQVALSWLLDKPGVMPIPRTNDIKHLEENMDAENLILEQSDIEEIEDNYPRSLI